MSEKYVHFYDKKEHKYNGNIELPDGGRIVSCLPFKSAQVIFYDIYSPKIPNLYELGYRKITDERYLRAFICRNGSSEFTVDKKTDELSAGQVMFDFSVGDNEKFSFTSSFFKGVEIVIQLSSFDKESQVYRFFKPVIKAMKLPEKEIFNSDDYIFTYSSETEKRLDMFLNAGFEGLEDIVTVAYLILLGRSLGEDLKKKSFNTTDNQLIIAQDIYDCLTNEFEKKWTAKYFADKYKLGESTVKRYFKKIYGYGFREYQTKVRMEYAAQMLTTSDIQISDISDKVGFADYRMFTNAFKRYYDCTPSEYRYNANFNH